jgi:hypothetical protein
MKKMKRKVIKLKESDLERLVKKIIKEEKRHINELGGMEDNHPIFGDLNFNDLTPKDVEQIKQYFKSNPKKSIYKTDDGDLEHGTFDDEDIHNYVSYGLENNMEDIFDMIGIDMPIDLEGDEYENVMSNAYDTAFSYFKKYPEDMTNKFGRKFKS